jgi:hypothetical protein
MENQEIGSFADLIRDAAIKFFHNRLEKELKPLAKDEIDQRLRGQIFSAQIALRSDDTVGVLTLRTDREFLHETHPERKYGEDLEDDDFEDWAAEIVNRVLGGLKKELHARNIETNLQPPKAVSGELDFDFDMVKFEVSEIDLGNVDFGLQLNFALRRDFADAGLEHLRKNVAG